MPQTKVVDLVQCRDLLTKWSAMRDLIIRGEIRAVALCIQDRQGNETVALCGEFERDPAAALRAAMKMSWELTKQADEAELKRTGS